MKVGAIWIFLGLALLAARAGGEMTVDVKPPTVERKTFDPAHRPEDLPPLKDNEAAYTQAEFECNVGVRGQVINRRQQGTHFQASVVARGLAVTLHLKIVLWLPIGVTDKLVAHEEGHRRITERVYEDAEKAARSAAKLLDNKTITGEGPDSDAAEKAAVQAAADRFCQAYLDLTAKRAEHLGELYDDITAHGTKLDPAEDEAIRQTFEKAAQE